MSATALRGRTWQRALAMLWVLDGALQFQPWMYSEAFPRSLASAAAGNPPVIAAPMRWADGLLAGHLGVANTACATLQLLIGLGLLWHRSVRVALACSVGWSLTVWWFGEGFGGILAGATPADGVPGAVILYAVIAVLVWPGAGADPSDEQRRSRVACRAAWSLIWGAMAVTQALHGSPAAPGWAFAASCALVAGSIWSTGASRAGFVTAIGIGVGLTVAQRCGGLLTGTATDVGTGPLLVLLGAISASRGAWSAAALRGRERPVRPWSGWTPGDMPRRA